MKMEKSKVDTWIAISPNTWHASKLIHISPQDSEYVIYGDNKQRHYSYKLYILKVIQRERERRKMKNTFQNIQHGFELRYLD